MKLKTGDRDRGGDAVGRVWEGFGLLASNANRRKDGN